MNFISFFISASLFISGYVFVDKINSPPFRFFSYLKSSNPEKIQEKYFIPSNIAFGQPTEREVGGNVIKVTTLNPNGSGSLK